MKDRRLSEFDENGNRRTETRGGNEARKVGTSIDFGFAMGEDINSTCVDVRTGEVVDANDIDPVSGRPYRELNPNPIYKNAMSAEPVLKAKHEEANRILKNILARNKMNPTPVFNSPDEMIILIEAFFERCVEFGLYPTKRGMAMALGTDFHTLQCWESGSRGSQYATILKNVSESLAEFDDQAALDGHINPILYIFRSKNYHGMRDVQDVVITPNNPLGETQDPATLQQKYLSQMKGVDPATIPQSTLETFPPDSSDS